MGQTNKQLLRRGDILNEYGLSETTFWRLRDEGVFPAPIMLRPRLKVWRRCDVEKWFQELASEE